VKKKRLFIIGCLITVIFLLPVTYFYIGGYKVNLTSSLPIGIYKTYSVTNETKINHGDTVIFCPPLEVAKYARNRKYIDAGYCPGNTIPMQKIVMALPGDNTTVENNFLHINGEKFLLLDEDLLGTIALKYQGGIVSDGHFLGLTYNDYSFDSRYFGEIPLDSIIAKTSLLLAW